MQKFILDGVWTLVAVKPEANNYEIKDGSSYEMNIPGSVQDALIEQAIVPDPYYADNELETMFIGKSDWNISRSFYFPKKNKNCHYILKLEKVDTVASLYLNGHRIAEFDNEHRIFYIDITEYLNEGDNFIEFRFIASEKLAIKRNKELKYPVPCSHYMYDSPNRNLVRKAQCNAAWDWGLCLQTIGIYESLTIFECQHYMLKSFSAIPKKNNDKWHLAIEAKVLAFSDCASKFVIEVSNLGSSIGTNIIAKKEIEARFTAEENTLVCDIEIPERDIELWWPNGYGKQVLYDVSIKDVLEDFKLQRKIGFRTIEVKNATTMGGKELTVCVNGQNIFCKGANWIPLDARPGLMNEFRFNKIVEDAKNANMNMLRIWGGGWYEKEAFYDACDKYGILIWHDLMFSCSTYPAEDWFLNSVEQELKDQINRLKSRTCIALWCGNNECLGALTWYEESIKNRDLYLRDYEKLYTNWIDRIILEEDPDRVYWPSSPCAGPGDYSDNWHSDGNGDMHYWTVWHEREDFEYYHNVKPRFCSEFGYQSFPSLSVAKSFAPDNQLNITSPIMEHHQRNEEGNSIIIEMFSRYFRFPSNFANQLYLSQVQQSLAIQTAVTYWRSLMPYCMGTLYWQLNDVWPVSSWSSIEYGGKWKALHYVAKRFYEPVRPLLYTKDDKVFVKVANDSPKPAKIDFIIKIIDFSGKEISHFDVSNVEVNSMCVELVWECELSKINIMNTFLLVESSYGNFDGTSISDELTKQEVLLLARPKKIELSNPKITIEKVQKRENSFDVLISSKAPAFFVVLDAGDIEGKFSDNCFYLCGEKTINFDCCDPTVKIDEFTKKLVVYDLYSSYQ